MSCARPISVRVRGSLTSVDLKGDRFLRTVLGLGFESQAMIGVRTLSLIEESGLEALRTRVKVPRSEVRGMIASTTITLASQSRLRRARAQL